jgi:hippurate hydrolase
VFGKGNVVTDGEPTMGGEDFSYMLQAKPGAYVFLGQGGAQLGCYLHNPTYDFNDEVIPLGAGYLAALPVDFDGNQLVLQFTFLYNIAPSRN